MARRWSVAVAVAAAMSATVPGPAADAEIRIGINGGKPSTWPFLTGALAGEGLTQAGWLAFGAEVGENWLPGTTGVALDYPAQLGPISGPNALSTDQSTDVGQQNLNALIEQDYVPGQPLAVTGLSEGTLVIDQEEVYLSTDPTAPSPKDLTFYVFGDMNRGLGYTYFPGVTVPFFGKTFGPLPDSQYNTTVVEEEWDGWANPPDRPWDALSDINAVMGAVYTYQGSNDHSLTALDSLSDAVLVSQTTSSRGGVTSTYIVPRKQLPITEPLLQIGVPHSVVDQIDNLLRPLIDAGYSSLTPNLGPYVDHGKLVWTTTKPATVVPSTTTAAVTAKLTSKAASKASVTSGAKHRLRLADAKKSAKTDTDSDGPTAAAAPGKGEPPSGRTRQHEHAGSAGSDDSHGSVKASGAGEGSTKASKHA